MEVPRLLLLVLVVLAGLPPRLEARQLQVIKGEKPLRYLILPSPDAPSDDEPSGFVLRSDAERSGQRAESRAFSDFPGYVGSYVYQGAVRRALIQPVLKGARRLIPGRAVNYYNNRLAQRRFFRVTNRYVYPVVSSYVYGKFESGVFTALRRSAVFLRDRFIEFEDKKRKRRAIESNK